MKENLKFVPFDPAKLSCETVFRAKGSAGQEVDAVVNQFGQVILSENRQAVTFEVKEMAEYPASAPSPAPVKS